jgi:hypothetical protein
MSVEPNRLNRFYEYITITELREVYEEMLHLLRETTDRLNRSRYRQRVG